MRMLLAPHHGTWLLVAILVLAVALAAAIWPALKAARADDGAEATKVGAYTGPTPTLDPRVATQMPLSNAAHSIERFARDNGLPGFVGIALDNDNFKVLLYWKGPLPPDVALLVETLRAQVPIDVIDRPYTLDEFQAESQRLFAAYGQAREFHIVGVGPTRDFSALEVKVESAGQIEQARQAIESPIRLEFAVGPRTVPIGYRQSLLPSYAWYLIVGAVAVAVAGAAWSVAVRLRRRERPPHYS